MTANSSFAAAVADQVVMAAQKDSFQERLPPNFQSPAHQKPLKNLGQRPLQADWWAQLEIQSLTGQNWTGQSLMRQKPVLKGSRMRADQKKTVRNLKIAQMKAAQRNLDQAPQELIAVQTRKTVQKL